MRADFQGGALSSDFGVMLLRGIDQHIGLSSCLARAFDDRRHHSYIDHPLAALFAQRTYQIACGYADGNDANTLRGDPLFKLGLDRKPLDTETDLASASTFSRLENAATARDIYRLAQAFVDQFIASYAKAPQLIVLEMDHSEDITHPWSAGAELLQSLLRQSLLFAAVSVRGAIGEVHYRRLTPGPAPHRGRECHDSQTSVETPARGVARDRDRDARR